MSQRSDYSALLRAAERAGCRLEWGGKHIRITTPSGALVVCSGSPSDPNAVHNVRKDLRKAGVTL